MISAFFIDRPIFASVISIIITLMGLAALKKLPIEQYPNMVPPQVQVTTQYYGADAKTVAENIAAPIEQQVNGVENMIYMYSQNSSTGAMSLSVFFDIGSNADMAQTNVQNRVTMAMPLLPPEVQSYGVSVLKQTPSILLLIAVQSPDGRYDELYTTNYADINVVNDLALIPGVSQVTTINDRPYAMRIWVRPDRMAQLKISAQDIVHAIQTQNQVSAVGQIGMPPTNGPVIMTVPVTAKGQLSDPKEFENIVLRANDDGSMVLIKDIGRVELGAQTYNVDGSLSGKQAAMIAVYQEYGANALDVAAKIKKRMEELSKRFPEGITYSIPYDTTLYINKSIAEVVRTIFEAGILVILVVLIFLQNWRATIVPVLAMLVSIIGTFAGMYAFGFSLNTLTLFGLVLAIGIVVDDAIVVIENVERNMREFGLPAKVAAKKAMDEVTGPVIAIVFVLCAVFIPVAFLGGIAGQLYKQFAMTISISVVFSGLVALTLSPALAALLLQKEQKESRFAVWFNHHFGRLTQGYLKGARWLINRAFIGAIIFGLLIVGELYLFHIVPTSLVPDEDQGYLMTFANMPDGSSLDRTVAADNEIVDIAMKNPAMENVISLSGFSMLESLNRINVGTNFLVLKDWDQRTKANMHANAVQKELQQHYYQMPNSQILTFNPPAIQGLGTVGGFEFWIENRGEGNLQTLQNITYEFLEKARQRPELSNLTTPIQADNMQFYLDLDRLKASSLGISPSAAFQTLQIFLGSLYVNEFIKFGRVYQVLVQADPSYRTKIDDISQIYAKSTDGNMVPMSSLVNIQNARGPTLVSRFNGFNAAKIIGSPAPGYSSGQAMAAMEEIAKELLSHDMTYSWSSESYQEKETGGTSFSVLLGGLIMVFLILSALYERWTLPIAVLLAVPFGIFGAILSIWIRGISNDVYFQVGLVTLIALSAKNAILIVEFAIMKHEEGLSAFDAALEAAKLRFRAILMTSLTFIFGVFPLVISTGPGANSRHSVGTGVMGGMIAATFFAVFFVPLFFRLVLNYLSGKKPEAPSADISTQGSL